DEGRIKKEIKFDYTDESNISKYYTIISLANIISGLYKVSVQDLYFDSYINEYVKSDYELLYEHIEKGIGVKLLPIHETFQDLVNNIHGFLKGDVEEIIEEIAFIDFFLNKNGPLITNEYKKIYNPNSFFIKECGFMKYQKKYGTWLYFNEKGLCEKMEVYDDGQLITEENIVYTKNISLTFLVLSTVNIAGGIYKTSIEDGYYDTWINSKTSYYPGLLKYYLEKLFDIDFSDYKGDKFKDLAKYIKSKLN
ncbi:MAG: hypothetical protein ACOCRK_12045, partial [bacterium]